VIVIIVPFEAAPFLRLEDQCPRNALEPLRSQESVDEIEQQPGTHEAGERIIEGHDIPSQPVAGDRVAGGQRKETEANGQHDDVRHFARSLVTPAASHPLAQPMQ
jgi:hypothetical protein